MLKRIALPRLVSGLAVAFAFVFVLSRTVYAIPFTLVATGSCDDISGGFVITYTATGNPISGLTNPSINILFDNVVVDNGAFENPAYSFSDTLPAPAGKGPGSSVTVTLFVVGTWSNGTPADQTYREASTTVVLPADACNPGTGRFTGGGNQITAGGVKVTRGLTLHCDLLLSNNLEINWGNGNKFHMLEHLTTLECSDDPTINQNPPPAPIDTLVGVGTGRYNGTDGFTIEFTLVDGGEPGRQDQMSIRIFQASNPGNVVLDVPLQFLTGGNLQAHADQPHKNK